jgi:uncharacterized membrane protein YgdD (TMEM256/DUF423 family)
MMERFFALAGSAFGFLAVALGAFGAHRLQDRLSPVDLDTFEIAVRYQMYHGLALLLVAILVGRSGDSGPLVWAGWSFIAGILVFSGSLYLLVLTGVRGLGAVTPFGGVALLAGWVFLAAHFLRAP